ncbi:MAG: hypothetical protein Q7T93_01115, partial [Methylobacterium sp.]|uniref:hypothetical protein n=1 Tax=Methylobacterium sp. TaxID=409 RepID=UPI00271A5710
IAKDFRTRIPAQTFSANASPASASPASAFLAKALSCRHHECNAHDIIGHHVRKWIDPIPQGDDPPPYGAAGHDTDWPSS